MTKRVSLPATLLSLGFLSVAIYAAGCGSDSPSGTGGAGGKAAGGKGGSTTSVGGKGGSTTGAGGKGGSAAGGSSVGGSSVGGSNGGSAAGGSSVGGSSVGGANGGAAGGANGGAAGGKAGAAGGANGGAAGGKGGAAGGANGGAAGGANGGAGGKGGAAAGGAGGATLAATLCPSTGGVYTASSTMKMTAADFCNLFLSTCGSAVAGHTTLAECMTTYTGTQNMTVATASSQNGTVGACESYHLCNAVQTSASVHCPHAAGTAICVP